MMILGVDQQGLFEGKRCSKCKTVFPITQFYKSNSCKGGHRPECKECTKKRLHIYYGNKVNIAHRQEYAKDWQKKNQPKSKQYRDTYWAKNPDKYKLKYERKNERFRYDLERKLYFSAKRRAKLGNIPFTIALQDIKIPAQCPAIGIPLKMSRGHASPNSPSLDRIIPEFGYVPGNVIVVSHMANTMKSNATLEQLKSLVKFYEKIIKAGGIQCPLS